MGKALTVAKVPRMVSTTADSRLDSNGTDLLFEASLLIISIQDFSIESCVLAAAFV